ncbi:hypothetical protein B6I21_04110 [candidate division KSB1 bacterium 4572_119]|nr:MAG: hypothetical protein B6I21_04110 [candidate division KSB1 bacterium 4572_119]
MKVYSKTKNIFFLFPFILLMLWLYPSMIFSQSDSLITIYEFDSPALSPWGLAYDGSNFYHSDDSLGIIYELSTTGAVLKTMHFPGRYLKGLTFLNGDLWVVSDIAVDDTMIFYPASKDSALYKIYSILKIDTANEIIADSIRFMATAANTMETNFLWGIGAFKSKLYVSYNGGYGPCTLEIDPVTKEVTAVLCCAHPCGLAIINDSLWCVRNNSMSGPGNQLRELAFFYWDNDTTTKGLSETGVGYELDCYATDLTYDEEHVWICDCDNNKIKKLSKIPTSVRNASAKTPAKFRLHQNYPNPFNSSTCIMYELSQQCDVRILLLNISGQTIDVLFHGKQNPGNYNIRRELNHLASGIYFYKLQASNFSETKKLILQK